MWRRFWGEGGRRKERKERKVTCAISKTSSSRCSSKYVFSRAWSALAVVGWMGARFVDIMRDGRG
jgi:hypothetical protein